MTTTRIRGFTLVEVMIAIFIAAIMFAIGYSAINQALRDRDSINTSQARVTEIQRGMRVVAQDFAQVAARPARDTAGAGQLMPAIMARNSDEILVTFTRAGWTNPAGLQRPAEQRVRYRYIAANETLVRESWLSVDPALNTEPRQRVIFTRVKSIELRYLDPVTRNWREDWPPNMPNGPVSPLQYDQTMMPRPMAIEFTLVLEDWGRVQRILEVPS
ncbi:MAG TPA: type II secretion system minor pseudopilin GspJ [Steroidobacteraceae bacterium]|nr:type II secretion system minor pseudopilin GspJ [Steroidobacteraceae bacterium]